MAVNFSTSGLILFIFTIFFEVLCGIFIILRVLAIRVSRREFYIDDGFIIFAYVSVSRVSIQIDWRDQRQLIQYIFA